MEIFDDGKRHVYVKAKEESLKTLSDAIAKQRLTDNKTLVSKINELESGLLFLKSQLQSMSHIPDFDWERSVSTLNALEREALDIINNTINLAKHQSKTK